MDPQVVDCDQLPPGWVMYFDDSNQEFYYFNHITRVSQWERPKPHSISTMLKYHSPNIVEEVVTRSKEKHESNDIEITTNTLSINESSNCEDIVKSHNESINLTDANYYSDNETNNDQKYDDSYYSDMDSKPSSSNNREYDAYLEHNPNLIYEDDGLANRQKNLNQDYLHLAKMYTLHRKYEDVDCKELCVLCRKLQVSDAFFPCNHRCVCKACIVSNDITEHTFAIMNMNPKLHFTCPLCCSFIKRIIPMNNGEEIKEYYDWCYDVKPVLPHGFEKKFGLVASALTKVYITDAHQSKSCSMS